MVKWCPEMEELLEHPVIIGVIFLSTLGGIGVGLGIGLGIPKVLEILSDGENFISEKEKALEAFNSEVAAISKEYARFAAGMIYFFLDDVEKQGLITKVGAIQDEADALNFLNEVEFNLKKLEGRPNDGGIEARNGVIERNNMMMSKGTLKAAVDTIDLLRKFFKATQELRMIFENSTDLGELQSARKRWVKSLEAARNILVPTDMDRVLGLRSMEEESRKLSGSGLSYPKDIKDIKDHPTDLTNPERKF